MLRQYYALRMLRSPVVFGLSIPVALVWPSLAPYTWLLIAVLGYALRRWWPADDDIGDRPGDRPDRPDDRPDGGPADGMPV